MVMKDFGRMRGFTLLELMIVVVLIALFAAFAVPAFKHRMEQTKVESAVEELLAALRFARGEAIARGKEVSLQNPGGGPLEQGWRIAAQNFGGVNAHLRERSALKGVKICTVTDCDKKIVFTFTPRGSMKVSVDGGAATNSVTLLVRPEIYKVAGDPSSFGAGLLMQLGSLGHARVSEDI
jgi:type II secretion system protein H